MLKFVFKFNDIYIPNWRIKSILRKRMTLDWGMNWIYSIYFIEFVLFRLINCGSGMPTLP